MSIRFALPMIPPPKVQNLSVDWPKRSSSMWARQLLTNTAHLTSWPTPLATKRLENASKTEKVLSGVARREVKTRILFRRRFKSWWTKRLPLRPPTLSYNGKTITFKTSSRSKSKTRHSHLNRAQSYLLSRALKRQALLIKRGHACSRCLSWLSTVSL